MYRNCIECMDKIIDETLSPVKCFGLFRATNHSLARNILSTITMRSSERVLDIQYPSVVLSACHWHIDQNDRLNAPIVCNQHLSYDQYKFYQTQLLARFLPRRAVLHTFSHPA